MNVLYDRIILPDSWKEKSVVIALNPGFPFRILSHSFAEKSEVKPERISHVLRWHRDVNLSSAKATRHTECFSCCVLRVKTRSKAIDLHGVWALCSPNVATAAD